MTCSCCPASSTAAKKPSVRVLWSIGTSHYQSIYIVKSLIGGLYKAWSENLIIYTHKTFSLNAAKSKEGWERDASKKKTKKCLSILSDTISLQRHPASSIVHLLWLYCMSIGGQSPIKKWGLFVIASTSKDPIHIMLRNNAYEDK